MKIEPVALAERVEWWQKYLVELGIAHWRIDCITITDELENANASVWVSSDYDTMAVRFDADFVEEASAQRLDEAIVHELLHVWMRDLDRAIDSAEDYLSAASRAEWSARIDHERENMVEQAARLIVRLSKRPPRAT